jgi:hypothetical protein
MRAIMTTKRKVAVVTGASRGIGARLVEGFRQIGYGVVANSRAISQAGMPRDPYILLVDGDIATPERPSVLSARPSIILGELTRWSTTPESSSQSPSLTIPRPISQRWSRSISQASSTSRRK